MSEKYTDEKNMGVHGVHYASGPDHHDHDNAPSRRGSMVDSHGRRQSHSKMPYAVAEHEVKDEEIEEGEDIIAAHDEFT